MITNTGGPAVIATDVFVNAGLEIPPLSERAEETLKTTLFPEATVSNPVDVLATAGAGHFRAAMDVMMDEDQVDSLYINFVTPFFVDAESIAREMVEVNKQQRKPVVCNLMTDKRQWAETLRLLRDNGIPSYSFPGMAARALAALTHYHEIRSREIGEVIRFDDVCRDRAEGILQKAKRAGREILSASEVYELLTAYGIPVADWRVASNAEEAGKAAAEIGFPVVVKADSDSIVHKSDVGGVAVNLKDGHGVRSVVEEMAERLEANDLRFLIQKYLPDGLEVIAGAKAETGLGHIVMFGIGGIYVEVLKEVVFKLTPLTAVEAREMLSSIQAATLLKGVRGGKGVDEEGLIEILQRLSQLVTELPMIQEMDLNPIIAYEDRVLVVDARVSI
jgi:acetyltransferase